MSSIIDVTQTERRDTWRRGRALVVGLVRRDPTPFTVAVISAALFAGATVASSWALGRVTDRAIVPRFQNHRLDWAAVLGSVGLLVGVGAVRAVAVVGRRVNAARAQKSVEHLLRLEVVDHLHAQPVSWFDRHATGELLARGHADAEAATQVLAPLPYATGVVVLLVVATAWLLFTDVVLGLCAAALFPVLVTINVIYQHRVEPAADAAQEQISDISAAVHETLDGVLVVKAFRAEARETERIARHAARLRDSQLEVALLRASFETLLDGVPTLATVLLVLGGAWRVSEGAMTVGQVVAFVNLFTILVWPLRLIGFVLGDLPRSLAGYRRIESLLATPPPVARADPLEPPNDGTGVSLQDVSFAYELGRPILTDVELDIGRGTTVAIVGATGSGKSTLLAVVAGLLTPDTGSVRVADGACLVFQETFLFAESVRDNITLGLECSDDDVWAALTAAQAQAFVAALPGGLSTELGERGVTLSGGQRQRVALARALVRHPPLLLLDDATSALDPTTDARVLAALAVRRSEMTVVMVASRPSTIALADQVVYMDRGRIVARGTHRDLLERFRSYRHLVEAYERERDGI